MVYGLYDDTSRKTSNFLIFKLSDCVSGYKYVKQSKYAGFRERVVVTVGVVRA